MRNSLPGSTGFGGMKRSWSAAEAWRQEKLGDAMMGVRSFRTEGVTERGWSLVQYDSQCPWREPRRGSVKVQPSCSRGPSISEMPTPWDDGQAQQWLWNGASPILRQAVLCWVWQSWGNGAVYSLWNPEDPAWVPESDPELYTGELRFCSD